MPLTLHVSRHMPLFPMRSSESQRFWVDFRQHDSSAEPMMSTRRSACARGTPETLKNTVQASETNPVCVCVCAYKTPALLLGVVHARCKFIRVVFAATKMLLFKPECASCQELHASPSSAPLYLRSSNGSSLLCLRRTDTAWANQRCVRCASVTRMSNQNRARESAPPLAPANNGDKLN